VLLLACLFLCSAPSLRAPQAGPAEIQRAWDAFPVLVWRERHAGRPLPEELFAPFGGTLLQRGESAAWVRERGGCFLVFNAAGRGPLHLDADAAWRARVEGWIRQPDEGLLRRDPCLNDPQVRAGLRATLRSTLEARGGDQGLGLALGDEVSWTPNGAPFDLCRCEHCEARWRERAEAEGLPQRAPLTGETLAALDDGDLALLGPWLARRRLDQECLLELLRELGAQARAVPADRRVPVGLLGLGGRTPFGGIAPQRCDFLDFLECYPLNEARELEQSRPGASDGPPRSLATVFLQEESPAGAAWCAWEAWAAGSDGLVLWSDTWLEQRPAVRSRLGRAVADLRALEPTGALRARTAAPRGGVFLVQDEDSLALAWLRDALEDGRTWPRRFPSYQVEHGSRERRVRRWQRALAPDGGLAGALPLDACCGPDCAHTVLILPEILVLSDDDLGRLERHLERGGTLVIDGTLGWVDRAGRPRAEPAAARLAERAPGRLFRLEDDGAELPPGLLERLRAAAGPAFPPLPRVPGEARDWRVRARPLARPDGTPAWRLVLLPEASTPAARRTLADLPLDVRAPEGWVLERLHPRPDAPAVLPAGDAAVFLLTPNR